MEDRAIDRKEKKFVAISLGIHDAEKMYHYTVYMYRVVVFKRWTNKIIEISQCCNILIVLTKLLETVHVLGA